jgi:hypothetical protein
LGEVPLAFVSRDEPQRLWFIQQFGANGAVVQNSGKRRKTSLDLAIANAGITWFGDFLDLHARSFFFF